MQSTTFLKCPGASTFPGRALRALARPIPRDRRIAVVTPLALTALATCILLLSVDFRDPVTTLRAAMSVALLAAVFTRQTALIVDLEETVRRRERQLAVMGEVVSALNTSANVGSTLRAVLAEILTGVGAEAGAIWLPDPGDREQLQLVEQIGLPDPALGPQILQLARGRVAEERRIAQWRAMVPGRDAGEEPSQWMTVRIGRRAEDQGFLTVMKSGGAFDGPDQDLLAAIGGDIAGTLRSIRLIDAAHHLADRDPVTDLYNHRFAVQQLYRELDRHGRTGRTMTVLMLDLDNFKLFNDTYGHAAGDEVLRQVGGVLGQSFRDTDTVARYGGDEFLVILPETSVEQALMCARRFQERLSRSSITCGDSDRLPLFTCCGIASYPHDTDETLELIAIADANLYAAKSRGKGHITTRALDSADDSFGMVEGFDLLRSLVIAVDNKDRYTRQHSEEVTAYALEIAKAMGLDREMLRTIHVSGLLHDLGKIGVPERVLRKPGKLTPDEIAVMNQHPVIGAMIVGSMPGMEEVTLGVRHHHERYDGKGYPDGLTGQDIPLIARIIAVGDVFSAVTTHRSYRKAFTETEALDLIEKGLGAQFDPEIGALFIRLRREAARGSTTAETGDAPLAEGAPACSGADSAAAWAAPVATGLA